MLLLFRRFTKNASLFDLVGNIMKDLPDGRSTLGGNAPVMTKRFVREGVSVLLISSISPSLKNELSSDVQGGWFLNAFARNIMTCNERSLYPCLFRACTCAVNLNKI